MKVCIVTTAFPRWRGDGLGSFILEAARAVRARDVQVRVVAMHDIGAKTMEVFPPDIEIYRPRYMMPESLEILQKAGGGIPVMWWKSILARFILIPFFFIHTLAIMRYARDCDIIHANWTLSAASIWLGSLYHRRPYLVTVQGSDIFQATRLPLVTHLTRKVLNSASHVFALSSALKQATVSIGVQKEKIEVLPNGVDTKEFFPSDEERQQLVIYVGWLIERKGVKYLIEAMAHAKETLSEYRLILIGQGPQKSELVNTARSLGISDRVDFLGSLSTEQVSDWMRKAKLLVLPSLEEGLGVVLLEALASGTPCVASNVGGISDVISPDVGSLVEPGDSIALAEAMEKALSDQDQWLAMSKQARTRAKTHFSWDSISKRLVERYHIIANRSSGNGK
jgi:glycosyltransferase involved in cell wall biosynthesis